MRSPHAGIRWIPAVPRITQSPIQTLVVDDVGGEKPGPAARKTSLEAEDAVVRLDPATKQELLASLRLGPEGEIVQKQMMRAEAQGIAASADEMMNQRSHRCAASAHWRGFHLHVSR